jgi:hypothetical protein
MKSLITLPVTEGHVWHRVHSELIMLLDPFWLDGFPVWQQSHETNKKLTREKGEEKEDEGGG